MSIRSEDFQGEVIAERFRLGPMIGKGGYGAVFQAEQLSVGRCCAVKILLPRRADDQTVEQRFRIEARTTSRLNHPNTVVVYDFGVDEKTGFLFLATEYLDGCTLHEMLQVRETLDVPATLSVLDQVASSLVDAHSNGLVHRDVKPKNIMLVDRAGHGDFVKVIDFGIAKALEGELVEKMDLTKSGMLIGTPNYLAPECLVGNTVDRRADQYALALVGYRMLTGCNPFRAGTAVKTAMRQVRQQPLPLRTYRPELKVSDQFEQVFLRALDKQPRARHDGVAEFVDALHRARSQRGRQSGGELSGARGENPSLGIKSSRSVADTESVTPTVNIEQFPTVRVPDICDQMGQVSKDTDENAELEKPPSVRVPAQNEIKKRKRDSVFRHHWPWWLAVGSTSLFAAVLFLVVGDKRSDEQTALPSETRALVSASSSSSGSGHEPMEPKGTDSNRVSTEESVRRIVAAVQRARTTAGEVTRQRPSNRAFEAESATINVTLIPWGTLYIDGRPRSDEVRQELTLSGGRYELALYQRGEIRAARVVDVRPGQSKMVTLEAEFDD